MSHVYINSCGLVGVIIEEVGWDVVEVVSGGRSNIMGIYFFSTHEGRGIR